ncbi:unnamed protein product [Closterium sp. NIES-53]
MHNDASRASRVRAPASVRTAVFFWATLDSRSAAALAHHRPAVLAGRLSTVKSLHSPEAIRALIVRRGSPGGGGYGPASARAASPGGTAGAGGAGGTAGGAASAGGTRGAAGAGGAGAASPRCYSHNRLEFA